MSFMGKDYGYWMELERRADEKFSFNYSSLLEEIGALRGRVSFYESRIKQMHNFMCPQKDGGAQS